jgi:Flp pilus assembly protein TadD/4-amino-4-deoxy-L-arabinose transferase-like glycosyltransferase
MISLLGVFALGLGVRLLYLAQIRSSPAFSLLLVDSQGYDAWARRLAAGDWLGSGVFYQAPLYPYFLGLVYALLGTDLLVVRLVQALLGAVSCVLLAGATARFLDRRTGVLAGALLAVSPAVVFSEGLVQKSVLDVFFLCLLLFALARALGTGDRAPWLFTGLAFGGLVLTRENAAVFAPLLAACPWGGASQGTPRRGRLPALALLALGVALALAPVAIRNKVAGGELFLTTSQLGPNLYIGNNPQSRGTYAPLRFGREEPASEQQDARELAEAALGRRLTPAEVSAYWRGRALDFVRSAPGSWLRLMGRKILLTLNTAELPDAYDQYTFGDWSPLLRWLGRLFPFGLLLALAVAGMALARPRWRVLWPLAALAGLYAASVALFYVFSRYRLPLVPLLVPFAALFLAEAASALRRRAVRPLALPLAAGAAAAVIGFWPLADRSQFRAAMLTNIANTLIFKLDRSGEAVPYLEEVLRLQPGFAPFAYFNLGAAYEKLGRPEEALPPLLRAAAQDPSDPHACLFIGRILKARGQTAEALSWFRRGLQADPRQPTLLLELGTALLESGDVPGAVATFERARAAYPDDPGILGGLGLAHFAGGDFAAAAGFLGEAVRLDARWSEAEQFLGRSLARLGRAEEAERHLGAAVRLDPGSAGAIVALADVVSRRGRPAEARALLQRLSAHPAADRRAFVEGGELAAGLGEAGLAAELRRRAGR